MRIAIFDYFITTTNPAGSCHRYILQGLCHEHEFTVFAVEFTNPCPARIQWVRIPAPRRPLFLLFLVFHILGPLYYWFYCLHNKVRFDLVQTAENCIGFGAVRYIHMCHQSYLKHHWKQTGASGLRGRARWIDHVLRATNERWMYRRLRRAVVPSKGLAESLTKEYPYLRDKIKVIPNPVDAERLQIPETFNASILRQHLGMRPDDVVQVFMALGNFEHKGLPLILGAMQRLKVENLKLVVVGGTEDLIREYRTKVRKLGQHDQVIFLGFQQDVRPYLWASDVFVFPSAYESFSLVSFQAAAACLPIIVTNIHGVDEFIADGINGFLIERSQDGVTQGLSRFLAMAPNRRREMGEHARKAVEEYDTEAFITHWKNIYQNL